MRVVDKVVSEHGEYGKDREEYAKEALDLLTHSRDSFLKVTRMSDMPKSPYTEMETKFDMNPSVGTSVEAVMPTHCKNSNCVMC